MKYLIIGLFIVVSVFLIRRSKQTTDPIEQACAREIGELIKRDPDAVASEISAIFEKHGIAASRCKNVGAMVMPQLRKQGLRAENARIAMIRVRAGYLQDSD
ncbi:MAG: hypothetical protein VX939_07060 [Pseudomonadota bacterium]|nr:hypothetical protein [Pseudomonadota bacterium]